MESAVQRRDVTYSEKIRYGVCTGLDWRERWQEGSRQGHLCVWGNCAVQAEGESREQGAKMGPQTLQRKNPQAKVGITPRSSVWAVE